MKKNNLEQYYKAMMELHDKFPKANCFAAAIIGDTVSACSYNCDKANRSPIEPLTALLSTDNGLHLLMEALAGVSRYRARQIYELIGNMLGLNYDEEDAIDDDDEDMEGDEWKLSTAQELCGTCVHFHESKCGFGKCKHHKGAFDGTQTTAQVTGNPKGCEYYEEKNGYEID